jgi:hypothetical protein
MPTRQSHAQELQAQATHLLRQSARIEAELELAEAYEEARQEAALIRGKAQVLLDVADELERLAAARVLTLLGRAEPQADTPPPSPPSASGSRMAVPHSYPGRDKGT